MPDVTVVERVVVVVERPQTTLVVPPRPGVVVRQQPTKVVRAVVPQAIVVGARGSFSGASLYIQPDAPQGTPLTYLWVQTGLGPTGTDMTFWVEDGQ